MPSSAVRTFSDPDDYTTSFRGSQAELTITERGQFSAKLTLVRLHCVQMQRFWDNLPRILHVAHVHRRASISFLTGPRQLWGSTELHPADLTLHNLDQDHFHQSFGLASSGFMSLPVEDLVSVGATMIGCDLTPPKDALTFRPAPHAIAKLRRLHAAAGDLAEQAPEIIANPDAARGLEQALIEAVVGCLSYREERKNSWAYGQHALVMRRFWRVVEENPEQPLYIPEICSKIGVSESTLRMCCQEHLGMAPKRYLLLRRMGLARRALRQAEPDATSVTAIGTRYGFWELGRFAVVYQSLFGESPSATLRRQPE
jgi:AraC-like DNA-binding protein